MNINEEVATLIKKVSDPDYELPAEAEIRPGTEASRAEALAMLLDAAETPEEQEMVRNIGGRPTLDPAGATSVSWRLRVPTALDAKFRALVEAEGRSFSAVLRRAAEEYVTTHAKTH